jgi:hypothetical protein
MHMLVFVFVRDSVPNVRAEVERLMAGSNLQPGREYPSYQKRCSCVGEEAYWDSFRAFDESPRGIVRKHELDAAREAGDETLENRLLRERILAAQALQLQHPGYDKPDPECSCRGAGFRVWSCDPAHHHDWWGIGGRWDGFLARMGEDILDGDGNSYPGNVARARDIPTDTLPSAFITADGLWYEKLVDFSSGLDVEDWIPYEKQEYQRWSRQVADAYVQHQDHLVVAVDVHL